MNWLIAIIISIPNTIYQGWVLSLLWLWFVTPLGIGSIGVVQAIGINLVVRFLTISYPINKPKDFNHEDHVILAQGFWFVIASTVLFSGYVVSLFL